MKSVIKMKWDGMEWTQYSTQPRQLDLDVNKNSDLVDAYCGAYLTDFDSTVCWLDSMNWSLMKQSEVTESLYQLVTYGAYQVKEMSLQTILNVLGGFQ